MNTYTDRNPEDRELAAAIARDRADDPAPRLSEAAMARIMAEVPQASAAATVQPGGSSVRPGSGRNFGLSAIAGLFRPPVWQAFAIAGVAGLVAGGILPAATLAESDVTPEQEFAIYLQSDDAFATLLEEDL
ncbi:hypothetical protein FF098_016960 [Parvularcula flava]|nr:hypothetical protein [Aquisalinus luteolus]NHK29600.1 hypothetical protein [Aquisalinus luteolus]